MKLKRTSPEEVYTQLERYDVDPPGAHRTEEMKVLVLGMSRTGTMCKSTLTRASHHKIRTPTRSWYCYGEGFHGSVYASILVHVNARAA